MGFQGRIDAKIGGCVGLKNALREKMNGAFASKL